MNAIRNWLENLSAREQILVTGGVAVVCAALIYALVIEPLSVRESRITTTRAQYVDALSLMARLTPADVNRNSSRGQTATSGTTVLSEVSRVARNNGLESAIRRISPDGDSAAVLTLADVGFDRLAAMLIALETSAGVRVTRASVDATGNPGLVNATLTLNR